MEQGYDAAGNVLSDNFNNCLYDPEGRLCAVAYPNGTGGSYYEQYLYDAEGRRVAKGSVGSLTCAAPDAGFTLKNQYLLGQGGEQVTELNGAGTVQHTNAFIGGKLLATYDFVNGGLHFALTDPLGTRRVQVSGTGTPELNCLGLPFGNSLGNARATNCVPAPGSLAVAPDATEHHFTGKERDTESGNDYFGARYYASSMGRFMSPDWASNPQAVPYVDFSNPQSLNLFVYALNNPLNKYDLDGHDWRTYYQQAQKWAADHPRTMYAAKAVMVGTVTVAAAVVLVATLPVSAPATLVGAAVVGLSTAAGTIAVTGGAVATTLYAGAAITGNQDMANGAGPAQTLTNPSGFTGTVLSGGNMEVGGVAASVSDIATGDPVAAVSGAVDLTVNILNSASTQAGQDQIEMPPTDYYLYPDTVMPQAQTSQPK
jgi:RHS repeat-associated protein